MFEGNGYEHKQFEQKSRLQPNREGNKGDGRMKGSVAVRTAKFTGVS